jgi:hypothetical protein
MPRRDWTSDELTVLLGLFYSRAFREGDTNHPTNGHIAAALNRTGPAIDFQWRNISSVIRPTLAKRNVASSLTGLIAKYVDNPAVAVIAARRIASKHARELVPFLPRPQDIDRASFSSTCHASFCYDVDAVLTQLVWVRPHLALSQAPADMAQIEWLATRLQSASHRIRCRLRTLFAIVNAVEFRATEIVDARKQLEKYRPELLRHDNFHDTLARAQEACDTRHWCLDTLLR